MIAVVESKHDGSPNKQKTNTDVVIDKDSADEQVIDANRHVVYLGGNLVDKSRILSAAALAIVFVCPSRIDMLSVIFCAIK